MPSYYDLANRKEELIRKALEGSVFIAPMTAPLVETITSGASGELAELPPGYTDVGWVDQSDGVVWQRKVTTQDTDSWGSVDATRRDISKDEQTLKFTCQETKREALELYYGLDLAGVTADPTSKEVHFNQPPRPMTRYFRAFGLFVDGAGTDTVYVGRLYPKANVVDMDQEKWTGKDSTVSYPITITGNTDMNAGFAVRHFFGGPGWQKLLEHTGFAEAEPVTP